MSARPYPQIPALFRATIVVFLLTGIANKAIADIENPCDPAFTSFNAKGQAILSPSGDQIGEVDTQNLQCLADAIRNGAPFAWINLGPGEFYLNQNRLECPPGAKCTLAGNSRDGTVLRVPEGLRDCRAILGSGVVPSALTLYRDWTIKNATFALTEACIDAGVTFVGLAFTGLPATTDAGCPDTTMNSTIDNVLITAEEQSVSESVFVAPTGRLYASACNDRLLGIFNTNRLEIDGPKSGTGMLVSMQSGARDYHDRLTVRNTRTALWKVDSNQNTVMNFCTIEAGSTADVQAIGVLVSRNAGEARFGSTNISNSTIRVDTSLGARAAGVFIHSPDLQASYRTSVSKTTFETTGDGAIGILVRNSGNGSAAGNSFIGDGIAAISIENTATVPPTGSENGGNEVVTDWAIVGNKGFSEYVAIEADVRMSEGTIDNVIAPHPNMIVDDQGCNFDLNQANEGCAAAPGTHGVHQQRGWPIKQDLSIDRMPQFELMEPDLGSG